ncbi:Por secretion system C-terminal sorting domain-containing protein [Aquimarina amphilecti]|uniref:Por secretion system C-terminal sorting domain-containing protein n=1 Tax=Aquimarina amphilecti TaxID=1038014 RepID=A0A1H7X5T9_AQUAM|nr:PKD domain-containing protein [Aquimarina amphilecti]SEM29216.1 Por secretion system C-terminal sorting domain-containing protein [Aquimarina amphilecti]
MKKIALLKTKTQRRTKQQAYNSVKLLSSFVFLFFYVTIIFSQENKSYHLGNEKAFTQTFWNKKSDQVTLNVSKDLSYKGLITKKEGNLDTYSIIGSINNDDTSTFHITKQKNIISGHIILYKEKIAYRYYSDDINTVLIQEIDIHKVLCVDFEKINSKEVAINNASARAPILSSLPGSAYTVYLDFDGEVVSDTWWVNGGTINAQPTGYSDAKITEIWRIMAEDFRPFDINITTDRATFENTPINQRMMCIFTPTTDAAPGSGGVAYLNSFSNTSIDNPCWVYNNGTRSAGETGSHEVGHTLGLSHDGVPGNQYYAGHSDWSPIMGWSASKPIGQWSKGEYDNAITQEDDMAIISGNRNGFGYKEDDHADVISEATPIQLSADNTINPALHEALISTKEDIDIFSFITSGGEVNFNFDVDPYYPNLNIQARIISGTGEELAISNTTNNLGASINTTLAGGTYFIEIDGVGEGNVSNGYSDYASVGFYEISGSYTPGNNNQPPIANFEASIDCDQVSFSNTSINTVTSFSWDFGDGTTSVEQNPTHMYTQNGVYTVSLTATNTVGEDTNTKENLITINIASLPENINQSICSGDTTTVTASGSTGYIWYDSADSNTAIATGVTLDISNITEDQTFYVAGTTEPITSAITGIQDIPSNSGDIHQGGFNLVFDVDQPIILKKAKVVAQGSGNRTLQLIDATGTILETKTINIPDGENIININMNIPAGSDLEIGFLEEANLFRSNQGINYPYIVENIINIKRSSATTAPEGFYYYLYNWEISTLGGCKTTERAVVEINISDAPASPTMNVNAETNEISVVENYSSYQWYFDNQVIENATSSSYIAEETGTYNLEVFNNIGCSTFSENIEIQSLSTVDLESPENQITLYPNPTREILNIDGISNLEDKYSLKIVNSLGQTIMNRSDIPDTLNTSSLPEGLYFLLINNKLVDRFIKTVN